MPANQHNIRDILRKAVERHQAGDLATAERLYRQVLQAAPTQPDANHNLGTLARQKGRPAEALPYFDVAVRSDPACEAYVLSYAETLLTCDRPEDAQAQLEAALQRGHKSALLHDLYKHARNAAAKNASLRAALGDADNARLTALMRGERFAEAEAMLESAVASHPDAGQLWKLYAVVLARQGKEARQAFERAAALLPDDAVAQRNLARNLVRAGAWTQALQVALHLCKLCPDNGEDRAVAGNAARELGKLDQAIAHYRKALELDPGQYDVHNNLGNALKDAGLHDQAEACYRRAVAIKPDCAEAWCNLSVVCKAMGRYADAEEACGKAREIAPKLVGALIQAGDLAIDSGRFAEAEQLFREAMAVAPRSAEAWAGISRTRKMTLQDEQWSQGAAALADSGLAPPMEVYLRYALGKYFDDTRQFDAAFPQFQRANDLNKQVRQWLGQSGYDGAMHSSYIDELIAHFSRAAVNQPRFAHPSARPVLIVGMPRSGTSLTEQILASHPEVHGAGELGHWNEFAQHYYNETRSGKEPGPVLSDIAQQVLRRLHAIAPQAQRVVDKMPNNFLHVGLIHAAFPNARIIHMRRNPVDVCLSIYFNSFADSQRYASDLHHLAHYYREYERLMAHWRAVLPENAMLEVPYEALVQDQEAWTRKLIDFIGLPWDERCLRFNETERAVRTPSNWQVRQKITTSSVERWRNYEKFIGPLAGLLERAT